mmetsp:Transcript_61689/g.99773  ORF Transcript_61689/g.99773 Transcript_61689/m.99773 type:complete len:202 (+) Transcript_61689:587-1192(+)
MPRDSVLVRPRLSRVFGASVVLSQGILRVLAALVSAGTSVSSSSMEPRSSVSLPIAGLEPVRGRHTIFVSSSVFICASTSASLSQSSFTCLDPVRGRHIIGCLASSSRLRAAAAPLPHPKEESTACRSYPASAFTWENVITGTSTSSSSLEPRSSLCLPMTGLDPARGRHNAGCLPSSSKLLAFVTPVPASLIITRALHAA